MDIDMDWAHASSFIRDVFWHSIQILGRAVVRVLLLPRWPLSKLLAALYLVFAPAIKTIECVVWLMAALWNGLAALEPLYNFIFSAALVGIFAGLLLYFTSRALAALLGMYDTVPFHYRHQREKGLNSPYGHDNDETYISSSYESISSSSSSPWQMLSRAPAPATKYKADSVPSLLAQTIHEEESSDF